MRSQFIEHMGNHSLILNQMNAESLSVSKDQVTIVIPVKDEESAIGKVIDELRAEGYGHILVVDGYSTDKTLDICDEKKGIHFISQHGKGKTGAVKTAIENVATPYLLVIDGDFTYPAKDIERLLVHADKYAQVIGVRDRKNISRLHRLGNWVITKTFNLLFDSSLSDVCSGLYLLNTKFAKTLELSSKGFITEVEIAAQTAAKSSVTEVPIGYRERIGQGKLSTWNGFGILSAVVKLAWKNNPVLLLSAIGGLVTIPALGILGWVAYRQLVLGVWHSGLALTGVLLLLFGTQAITAASMSALMKRMEHRLTQRTNRN